MISRTQSASAPGKILGKNVTKSDNINRKFSQLTVLATVLNTIYPRYSPPCLRFLATCNETSSLHIPLLAGIQYVASGQNVSTSAYRRRRSFSVDRWPDIFRDASRSITVVSAGALDADCSMPVPFPSITSSCTHSPPLTHPQPPPFTPSIPV